MRIGTGEEGVALITVVIVLGSMALLAGGVSVLVMEGTKSANRQVSYRVSYASSVNGAERTEALINLVSVAGYEPEAPPNYGVQAGTDPDDCGAGIVSGEWPCLQAFGDYLRDNTSRPSGWTCSRNSPDIRFKAPDSGGDVRVDVCVVPASAGSLPGTGAGVEFAKTDGNIATDQSVFEVEVWATGSRDALAQVQGVARGIY